MSDLEDGDDDEGGGGAPAWMATFADLMSLLLTFFVLLLSFANMDVQYFQLALGSVKNALGVKTKHAGYMEARSTTPIEWEHESQKSQGTVGEQQAIIKIEAIIRRRNLEDKVKLEVTENTIVLKVYDLFEPGAAELDPRKFDELSVIVELCNLFHQPLVVEAHTDSRPIRSARFASNWELSAMRAGAVTRFLIEGGVARERLTVAGLADLRPIGSNETVEGRALNRRVAVVMARRHTTKAQITNTDVWK